jgi:hypothetical protein
VASRATTIRGVVSGWTRQPRSTAQQLGPFAPPTLLFATCSLPFSSAHKDSSSPAGAGAATAAADNMMFSVHVVCVRPAFCAPPGQPHLLLWTCLPSRLCCCREPPSRDQPRLRRAPLHTHPHLSGCDTSTAARPPASSKHQTPFSAQPAAAGRCSWRAFLLSSQACCSTWAA